MKTTILTALSILIIISILSLNITIALANASVSPDAWSNGISDSALENLPDADHPYVIQCGPFKNRETARPIIYKLSSETGMTGYFYFIRGAYEAPKDNQIMVRVGRFTTMEEAAAKFSAIKKGAYANLSIVKAYETSDELKDVVMLDTVYQEFDEGSSYVGRLVISCTPQVPDSVQNFVKLSSDGTEVTIPVHLSRIASNANEAVRRIRNGEHQLVKDMQITFDEQFNCHMITLKMKRRVELAKIKQYAPVIAIDFEKMPN